MTAAPPVPVRCAVYTRKSSEEGLEQGFNSLDAQREACAAYVLSQASEGWTCLPERYDDGGVSGGTLDRPALGRLLADIAAGRVDTVVVYKVDRLSRSLFDFAKLVEQFEAAGTSFVSVTQSFNTTSSMGRLTLNMLLSFAQFEREVTAERIRDKIAASKAKGMWMGGVPPLGYRPHGRSLAVVDEHADLTRHIFHRYLALGSVFRLAAELEREGRCSPVRTTAAGRQIGGRPFTRGQLHLMLKCPTYVGDIPHKGQRYKGLHSAIIDDATFDAVQASLAANLRGSRGPRTAVRPSLLAGLVVDEAGEAMVVSHATKGKVRYLYYASRSSPQRGEQGADDARGSRIPARELEAAVANGVAGLFDDPLVLAGRVGAVLTPATLVALDAHAATAAGQLRLRQPALIRALIMQVRLRPSAIEVDCAMPALAALLGIAVGEQAAATLTLTLDAALRRSGRAMRLVQANGAAATPASNPSLVRLMVKARGWWQTLRKGELTVTQLAAREGVLPGYVTRVVKLAFLSPSVTQAALDGRLRHGVDVTALTLGDAIPALRWCDQEATLLPSASGKV